VQVHLPHRQAAGGTRPELRPDTTRVEVSYSLAPTMAVKSTSRFE